MRHAEKGDTVKVHYTGTLKDGTVFDTSRNRDALEVTLGSGNVIPGFEDAVVGMSEGETKEVEIPPEDAYGPKRDELVVHVQRDRFPAGVDPREGMPLNLKGPEETVVPAVVTEVSEESVTIDANHPLAGEELTFRIELAEIL